MFGLPKNVLKAYTWFTVANLIWAAATPIIKVTLADIPPLTFLMFRFVIVAVILLPFVIVEIKKTPIDKRDWFNLFVIGFFGQACLALVFMGMNYTTSIDAVIIGVAAPLITIIAGHHFFNEKVTTKVKIGVAIASIGTFLVVLEPIFNGDYSVLGMHNLWDRLYGNGLILLYNGAFTAYLLWTKMVMGEKSITLTDSLKHLKIKPMHKKYPPLLITSITFYAALIVIIPLAFMEHLGIIHTSELVGFTFTTSSILGLLYMAIFSSIVAYFAFQWALNISTVGESAILSYVTPLLTLPFSYLLLAEIPTKINLIGSIIIAVGVVIAEYHRGKKKPA